MSLRPVVAAICREPTKEFFRLIRNRRYRAYLTQLYSLSGVPRYKRCSTDAVGYRFEMTDTASFLSNFYGIFVKEIYKFDCSHDPFILDCGANIGLSVLYFKSLFPRAQIIGFEPDPAVFAVLRQNVVANKLSDVDLVNNAVWDDDGTVTFAAEGGDAGRVTLCPDATSDRIIEVPAIRLRDYLRARVDLLKIDIEGAEARVLVDCEDRLAGVDRLFVEFHPTERSQDLSTLVAVLERSGFRLHVHPVNQVSTPLLRKSTTPQNLQLNVFAWRD